MTARGGSGERGRDLAEARTAVPDEEELDEVVVVGASPSRRRGHRAPPAPILPAAKLTREKREVITGGTTEKTSAECGERRIGTGRCGESNRGRGRGGDLGRSYRRNRTCVFFLKREREAILVKTVTLAF